MKKWIALTCAGLLLSSTSLKAEYDLDDTSSLQISVPEQDLTQFTLKGSGDYISRAKLTDGAHGRIIFAHAEADFDTVVWYNDCYQEGVTLGLSYEYTRLDWNKNPYFERKDYDTAVFSATYFTHRLCDWRWIFSAALNLDADKWNFNDYTTYDLLLWGRYQYCTDWGIHVGIYAETGMKLDRVYPVLGFDWQIYDNLLLSAVFPVNVSLVYTWDENWSFALAGRIFSDRYRAGKKGEFNRALWRYSNGGTEFAAIYSLCSWLTANAHVGYAWGGRLRVSSWHNHHVHHEDFNGSAYAGGEIALKF